MHNDEYYEETSYAYIVFWVFFVGYLTCKLGTRSEPLSLKLILEYLEMDLFYSLLIYAVLSLQGGGISLEYQEGDLFSYLDDMIPNMSLITATILVGAFAFIISWAANLKHAPFWQMVLKYFIYLIAFIVFCGLVGKIIRETIESKFRFLLCGGVGFLLAKLLLSFLGK